MPERVRGRVRSEPSILHVDLDAFYAAIEQRDKPSLRGRPVVVGGVGGRGVVATASYEARAYGVRSAMSTREARSRCPHAAYLSPRFEVYREVSRLVMGVLEELSPLVEPLSLDEAFVDLAAGGVDTTRADVLVRTAEDLRTAIEEVTGGLRGSVGIGSSKLIAKIASELDKPDGLVVVPAGTEESLIHPLPVGVLPGVGPATRERLRRVNVHTVGDLSRLSEDEVVRLLGQAHGRGLHRLSRAEDDRPVISEREAKSVSVEDTYDTDLVDPRLLQGLVERHAAKVGARLRKSRLSGRTVTTKVRLHDFSTHSRSATLPAPTDDPRLIGRLARRLLADVDTSGGVRLLGVGVSGLADWVQEDLFAPYDEEPAPDPGDQHALDQAVGNRVWAPGMDVEHPDHGRGWVWGAGRGRVTVRFETEHTPAGPVRTFRDDDPALERLTPPRRGT